MVQTIARAMTNPIVVVLSRIIQALGLALATAAVAIFMDVRSTQGIALTEITKEVKEINKGVTDLKVDSAVQNFRYVQVERRVKKLEDKVFQ